MIHSFLSVLYMLQYAAVREVHCRIPQPCMHGFLAFHVILVVVAFCVTFNISRGILGGPCLDAWENGDKVTLQVPQT